MIDREKVVGAEVDSKLRAYMHKAAELLKTSDSSMRVYGLLIDKSYASTGPLRTRIYPVVFSNEQDGLNLYAVGSFGLEGAVIKKVVKSGFSRREQLSLGQMLFNEADFDQDLGKWFPRGHRDWGFLPRAFIEGPLQLLSDPSRVPIFEINIGLVGLT